MDLHKGHKGKQGAERNLFVVLRLDARHIQQMFMGLELRLC